MEQQHFGKLLGLTITGDPELEKLRGSDKNCVKLRGIPFHATPEDVILFFGELKEDIAIQGVHMVLNAVVSVVWVDWNDPPPPPHECTPGSLTSQ